MIQYLYLGRVGYDEGLRLQAEIAGLVAEGRVQNVLLLLEHPPVLTLGRNANRSNILASDELLARRGVTVARDQPRRRRDLSRAGAVGGLSHLRPAHPARPERRPDGAGGLCARDGRGADSALRRVWGEGRADCGLTGVWCVLRTAALWMRVRMDKAERKIGAIGIHVARGITSHGFAFNVTTDLSDFALIVPCGIADHAVTSLEREVAEPEGVALVWKTIAHQAARQLRAGLWRAGAGGREPGGVARTGGGCQPQFPAEDTPLQVPAEVERLLGGAERPIRA